MTIKKTILIEIKVWLARATAVCAMLIALCSVCSAQNSTSLRGVVRDQAGKAIAGAEVQLKSLAGRERTEITDDQGNFEFKDLTAGEYFVNVKAENFATFASAAIDIEKNQARHVEFTLAVAGVNESVVITAAGTAQAADEVAKVVSVLDAGQIENQQTLTLSGAVRGVPGVRVQQQGSPGALTSIRLRGQRSFDTAILLDGLRVRDASDIGGSAASLTADLIPVAEDRIEVLRGAGSSIYGTNAIGGVINVVPESASPGVHFDFGAEGGGLLTFREHFKMSGGNDRAIFSVGVNRLDVRRGVDGNDQYGNTAGTGRFVFAPTNSTSVAVNLYGTIANARLNDSPFALPGAFSSAQPYPRAVAGVTFQPDFNNPDEGRRNRLLVGSVKFSQEINPRLSYSIAYQRVDSNRRNYNGSRIDPKFAAFYPFGDFEFLSVNKGKTDTFDTRLNAQLARTNLATFGFEFERESLFQHAQPSFSAFNDTTDRQRTFAFFGQDQIALLDRRLQISLAARGQFFRVRAADRPGTLAGLSAEKTVTGDGAVAYLIRSTNTKLRAHIGNGFRAASLFERFGAGFFSGLGLRRFGDPTLRAEQSLSLDGGIDQKLFHDHALIGASYFYTKLQRVIDFESSFVIDPLGLGRFSGYVNRPGGFARGLETFMEASPWRNSQIRASYTFTNSDQRLAGGGLRRQYVIPTNIFSANFYQRYRSFAFNANVDAVTNHIAPVFENDFPFRPAELTFAGYTTVNIFGSYERKLSEGSLLKIFAGADNIFNQRYYENGFLAPRAVGRAGFDLKF